MAIASPVSTRMCLFSSTKNGSRLLDGPAVERDTRWRVEPLSWRFATCCLGATPGPPTFAPTSAARRARPRAGRPQAPPRPDRRYPLDGQTRDSHRPLRTRCHLVLMYGLRRESRRGSAARASADSNTDAGTPVVAYDTIGRLLLRPARSGAVPRRTCRGSRCCRTRRRARRTPSGSPCAPACRTRDTSR